MTPSQKRVLDEYGIKSIVNYLRKSRQDEEREKKTGEDTLHEQKKLMDRVLSSYGIPYDQEPEIGSGDKISSRPVFQRVIKDLKAGKYDAIAVKEISRMGRGSYTDMGTIYDLIIEKNIYIITPYKIYDPNNPTDLRQIRFELFMSREEFETTRERLSGGKVNAAMEGKWVAGRAPFGYTYDQSKKRLEINEEEAEVVKNIFDFYANGIIINGRRKLVQFRALSTYLNRVGIKSPRGGNWSPSPLRNLLANERYIGRMKYRTTKRTPNGKQVPRPEEEHIVVDDAHPAIIDMETWQRVQNRMENREKTPRSKMDFEPCELAGLCVCKKCGKKMIRQYSVQNYKRKDGGITKYEKEFLWCTNAGCTFVKYRHIEEDLLLTLSYLKDLDDTRLTKQLEQFVVYSDNDDKPVEDMKKHISAKREELKRRMSFIFDKYESGIYSDEIFLERKAEIENQLKELENINLEESEEGSEEINTEVARENISTILEAYHAAQHKSDRNEILRAVFDHVMVEVIEKGRGRIPAKHAIYPILKANLFKRGILK